MLWRDVIGQPELWRHFGKIVTEVLAQRQPIKSRARVEKIRPFTFVIPTYSGNGIQLFPGSQLELPVQSQSPIIQVSRGLAGGCAQGRGKVVARILIVRLAEHKDASLPAKVK